MVGPSAGWAVGTYAIFATVDGKHWTKQYASTEEFVGVDFVSTTTGWAVGIHQLIGTTDGGHTWHQLAEPAQALRSVHFVSSVEGWGISGGTSAQSMHGWLIPQVGAQVVHSVDGGKTWTNVVSPANPQVVCFSDPTQGWLGTMDGGVYSSRDHGQTWTKVLQRPDHQQVGYGLATLLECAAPHALWVVFVGGGAAASHSPYLVYATPDGSNWKAVMEEQMTESQAVPGVPYGPDTYPPSFSVVDPSDAAFVGDGPATNYAQCVIATNGGAVLHRNGRIDNSAETFDAAFVSTTSGWVLTRNAGGDYVIDATTDGGYHWSEQLAVTPPSAG
jgi:photosystem II stability/assembly factor-like uncharacterized protein